jgi:hypothetical protein
MGKLVSISQCYLSELNTGMPLDLVSKGMGTLHNGAKDNHRRVKEFLHSLAKFL